MIHIWEFKVGIYEGEGRTTELAVLDAIEKLNKQDRKEIAHIVIDPVAMFILSITSRRCMTVSDISPAVNLPIATCYKIAPQTTIDITKVDEVNELEPDASLFGKRAKVF
ncbi:MAG: hypothetical protein HPY73_01885 [Methanomassiliicoccales archaeon]|nr:MAG: hypothetical protein HPY73_01885 [Methanomassiliicoccales archaeon]